jgi:hypothetical protein
MKKYSITLFILLTILAVSLKLTGCEQEDLDFYIDCDFCLEEIPEYDTLRVSVTINDENPFVPLVFYLGDIEQNDIDWVDTAYSETFWLAGSVVGQEYSVKATYQRDNETVVAIDGDKIRVVDGEGECYPPCFYVRGGTLDVRLK